MPSVVRIPLVSAVIGLGFPLAAWYIEILYHHLPLTLESLGFLHRNMASLWLMDTAPLILGGYGFFLGTSQKNLRMRLRDLAESENTILAVLNNLGEGVVLIDTHGIIQRCNPTLCNMFGYSEPELLGKNVSMLMPKEIGDQHDRYLANYMRTGTTRIIGKRRELDALRNGGERFPIELKVSEFFRNNKLYFIGALGDVSERKTLESQLYQAQKLESIGQLAAGIAHEINTPIQYVGDNLHALLENFEDLFALLEEYRECLSGAPPEFVGRIRTAEQRYDMDYIVTDTPKAIRQSIEGIDRVNHIVRAMKDFSHIDRAKLSQADINAALNNTLTIACNEYKYVADVATEFAELPTVECYASDLNQVFLNLIVNAAHAIAEKGKERGTITLATRLLDDEVEIRIGDTGTGIPNAIRERVFDPFFTTKEVGKGTGQGLHIAHQVISKHGGRLWFESEKGRGTTFFIRVPLHLKQAETTREAPGHDH